MKSEKITIRKPVFITMAVLYIAIIVLGLAAAAAILCTIIDQVMKEE